MDQQERLTKMKAAIIDLIAQAHKIPYLESVVLFGSVLEGDVNKKSDIDLLLVFDCPHNPETGKESKQAISIGGDITYQYNIENNFSFVVVNKNDIEDIDEEFLKRVIEEGVVVWQKGGFFETHPALALYKLVIFSTKDLDQNIKKKLERVLYGYRVKTRQKGKNYQVEKEGFITQYGEKIAPGVFITPAKIFKHVEKTLKELQVSYIIKDIWL